MSLVVFLFPCILQGDSTWLERKAEGWAWYEDKEETQEDEQPLPEEVRPILPPPLPTASEELADLKKGFEENLARAVLYPTPENIGTYLEEQMKWLNRSDQFATIWAKYLLSQPHLSQTAKTPVTQIGVQAYKASEYEKKQTLISALSGQYGLLFFFKGDCQLSKAFSQVVKMFTDQYKWTVLPVSLDGQGLDLYPNPNSENGIAEKVGVTIAPSLYAINPETKDAVPIGFGVLSLDQIEQNIVLQFTPQEDVTNDQ